MGQVQLLYMLLSICLVQGGFTIYLLHLNSINQKDKSHLESKIASLSDVIDKQLVEINNKLTTLSTIQIEKQAMITPVVISTPQEKVYTYQDYLWSIFNYVTDPSFLAKAGLVVVVAGSVWWAIVLIKGSGAVALAVQTDGALKKVANGIATMLPESGPQKTTFLNKFGDEIMTELITKDNKVFGSIAVKPAGHTTFIPDIEIGKLALNNLESKTAEVLIHSADKIDIANKTIDGLTFLSDTGGAGLT